MPSSRQLDIRTVRAYELDDSDQGYRLLVDRLWPRGVSKESLRLDRWVKELAPSTELRKWFDHDLEKWDEFRRRYRDELSGQQERIEELLDEVGERKLLLIYAAKNERHNHAIVLRDFLHDRKG